MDPQTQQMLSEALMLSRENNQMLHSLIREQRWAKFFRYSYWILIFLSLFGSYFFLQPYLSSLLGLYSGGATSSSSIQDLLKGLNSNQLQQDVNSLNQ
jgi:hypothetical protein